MDTTQLARTVAVINGKGGSGKTSVTANLGGQIAEAGNKVLLVDLDLSGNLSMPLGYVDDDNNDAGRSIYEALMTGDPDELQIISEVRPNLDVIPGGRFLKAVGAMASMPDFAGEFVDGGVPVAFAQLLAQRTADYDLVLLDCAPGNPVLQDMGLCASRYIVIPTRTSPMGWEGLRVIGPMVKAIRRYNPDLTYLGAVIFAHKRSAPRVLKTTHAHLDAVSDTVPLFKTFIGESESAAQQSEMRGQLAHELDRDRIVQRSARLAELSSRRARSRHAAEVGEERPSNVVTLPGTAETVAAELDEVLSESASGLAADYRRLAAEVLRRIATTEEIGRAHV